MGSSLRDRPPDELGLAAEQPKGSLHRPIDSPPVAGDEKVELQAAELCEDQGGDRFGRLARPAFVHEARGDEVDPIDDEGLGGLLSFSTLARRAGL